MKIPDGLQVGRFRYEPNAIPLVNRPARIDIEPTSRGPQRLESKRGAHDSFMDERRLKLVRHSGRTSRDEPYGAVEERSEERRVGKEGMVGWWSVRDRE